MVRNQLPTATESEEQIALFQWAALHTRQYPVLKLLYHIPNGGHRYKSVAGRLRAEGVKAGVPDVCLPVARGKYHGLYIEMKSGRNKPTENQNRWLSDLTEQGYYATVCHGWEAASNVIQIYLRGGF